MSKYDQWSDEDIDYLEWVKEKIEDVTGVYEGRWSSLPKRQMESLYVHLKNSHPFLDYGAHMHKLRKEL